MQIWFILGTYILIQYLLHLGYQQGGYYGGQGGYGAYGGYGGYDQNYYNNYGYGGWGGYDQNYYGGGYGGYGGYGAGKWILLQFNWFILLDCPDWAYWLFCT